MPIKKTINLLPICPIICRFVLPHCQAHRKEPFLKRGYNSVFRGFTAGGRREEAGRKGGQTGDGRRHGGLKPKREQPERHETESGTRGQTTTRGLGPERHETGGCLGRHQGAMPGSCMMRLFRADLQYRTCRPGKLYVTGGTTLPCLRAAFSGGS